MYVNLKSDYISVNQIFFSSQQSNNIDLIGADIGFSLSKWNKALYFILLQDDDNSGRVLWFYRVDKVYIEALTAKWIWNVWLWVLVVIFCILNIWYTTRYIYGIVYISTTWYSTTVCTWFSIVPSTYTSRPRRSRFMCVRTTRCARELYVCCRDS